jgi:hypothetical protein
MVIDNTARKAAQESTTNCSRGQTRFIKETESSFHSNTGLFAAQQRPIEKTSRNSTHTIKEESHDIPTETADDFILTETTSIRRATITGLIPLGTPLSSIHNVEIEVYRVFPRDSIDPPSGNVPSRVNSPGDVEVDTATRDGSLGTITFSTAF